mgnify:CR=1 FL=1
MKYVSVSPWWIIDEIRKGKKIYVTDRKLRKVYTVNDASIETVVCLIKNTETEVGRYDFWYEESEDENVQVS